jgi:hypothetical protein
MSGMTRRSLLFAGATAGAAVAVGARPWTAAAAGPGYLTRSAYSGLEGTRFPVETGAEPVVLKLESVSDIAGAGTRRALVGSDDAFTLRFSGPLASPLDSGIHTLRHPRLGAIELFSSPVDAPTADRNYEVVVDRSIGVAGASRSAPSPTSTPREEPEQAEPDPPEVSLVRRSSLRRAGHWVRCELVLRKGVEAERVRVRLMRKGHVVARGNGHVEDGRAVIRLEGARRPAAGAYTLVVTAMHAHRATASERRRVHL